MFVVIEDDKAVAEVFRRTLAKVSSQVMIYPTAEAVLADIERLRSSQVRLVISDFELPGMNGVEVLHQLSEFLHPVASFLISPNPPHKPLQGITVMQKPFMPTALLQAIRESGIAAGESRAAQESKASRWQRTGHHRPVERALA